MQQDNNIVLQNISWNTVYNRCKDHLQTVYIFQKNVREKLAGGGTC